MASLSSLNAKKIDLRQIAPDWGGAALNHAPHQQVADLADRGGRIELLGGVAVDLQVHWVVCGTAVAHRTWRANSFQAANAAAPHNSAAVSGPERSASAVYGERSWTRL